MNHIAAEMIGPLIDGELDGAAQRDAEQHLDACHACALEVLQAMQWKNATALAGDRYEMPAATMAKLRGAIQPQRATVRRRWALPAIAWVPLAACLLLVAGLAGWQRLSPRNGMAAELVDQHLATLAAAAQPQVLSTDRHTVKPWFQGRLPFSFNLPEPSALPPDTALQGADMTYLQGQPAALLLYTIHQHKVSVFVTQRGNTRAMLPGIRQGFSIDQQATPDLRLLAVSDVNPAELHALATTLARAQNPH